MWAWDKTLNSVVFGIVLMILLAGYVAVGSGLPDLRAWFEVTDAQFFNAWPMRLLAGLLVINLLTVSLNRIPFTLPRLGVWTIHAGIIVLIFGMTLHFSQKTEGMTLVRTGETVDWYYDSHERALYVTAGKKKALPMGLPTLPRFHAYTDEQALAERGLSGLVPTFFNYDEQTRGGREMPLTEAVDIDGDEPVYLDVVGYYPYALAGSNYTPGGGELTGLRLTLADPDGPAQRVQWIVADQDGHPRDDAAEQGIATLRLRHLHRTDELTGDLLASAAQKAHDIAWAVGEGHLHGEDHVQIEPGQTVTLGDSGYTIEAVAAVPGFPLSDGSGTADALELLVHPPADSQHGKTFRRYLLDGRHTPTDFVLDVEGAGPKGERQQAPVDDFLHLHYARHDALGLLPAPGVDEQHTILTKDDTPGFWHLVTRNDLPARIEAIEGGRLELAVNGGRRDPHTGEVSPMTLDLDVERVDGVRRTEWVQPVPPEQRDRQAGEAGTNQILAVRVRRGDWSQIVNVPFSQWPDQMAWRPANVNVPGLAEPLRFQLGNTRRQIPGRVTLDAFELVPYAGDFTADSAMRDFKSLLTVDPRGGEPMPATVSLNRPHYLDVPVAGPLAAIWPGESWLLFQSQWDPENQAFTVLGVGNRPGVMTMVVGCVMIVGGLLFAFYVKPMILNRRKAKALAAASAR